jgi:hypothetical protein
MGPYVSHLVYVDAPIQGAAPGERLASREVVEIGSHSEGLRRPHVSAKSDEEAMAKPRTDPTSFVGKLLEQDDIDALRGGVQIVAQALMETEVSSRSARWPRPSSERSHRKRLPDARVGHPDRHHRAQDPKVTRGGDLVMTDLTYLGMGAKS